jgi:hypothetical protein
MKETTFDFNELVTILMLLNREIEKVKEEMDTNNNAKLEKHYSRKFKDATFIKSKVMALAMKLDTSDADLVKCSLSN